MKDVNVMTRNLQFRRTDKNILDAFRKLMKIKTFESITVQNILDEAMINRSTFYAHFTDKYAVAERLQELVVNNLIKSFQAFQKEHIVKKSNMSNIAVHYQSLSGDDFNLLLKIKTDRVNILSKFEELIEYDYISKHKDRPYHIYESKLLSAILLRFMSLGPVTDQTNQIYMTSLATITCDILGVDDSQIKNKLISYIK